MALRILPPVTEPEPYSYLRQRQDWNNPLHHQEGTSKNSSRQVATNLTR
jgi:hypothetical protein